MRNALQSRIPACDGFSCPRTIGKPCNRCGDRGPKTVAPVVTPVAPVTPVPSPPLPWDPTQPAAKTPRVEDAISDLDIDLYRSEEHTSELQSLMRISYAVFCLKKKKHSQP